MQLNDFDRAGFLRQTWQRRPLLIRNPWNQWRNPISPDELAGLACEPGVEARLIRHTRKTWQTEHGPFPESRFGKPGKDPWTLLVQAVNQHVPDVAALIAPFRFVPDWRIEDVMVSYASDQGGVGPHYDQYDVFLIQGLGRRLWQIGQSCDVDTELLPHDDLRLLARFDATEEWVLEPGDILYLPPRIAHNGIALGDDCMTYSVGFRAPARSELLAHWCDHLLESLGDDDRYADPGLPAQDNPGEISADALARLHAMVTEKLADRDRFARWFGQHNSTRKYPDIDWRPEEAASPAELREALVDGAPLCRNPASRFAFVRQGEGTVLLFVDGECHECTGVAATFAEQLCAGDRFVVAPDLCRSDAVAELIAALFNQGSVAVDEPE